MMSIHPRTCRTPSRASFREKRFARSRLAIATSHILTGLILTGTLAGAATAQAEAVYELGEVVVTAARTSQTVDETLAPVTVINRQQIERSQASSVTELLSQSAPGVQVTSNGGPGSSSGVYIRGTKTAQTLILMNGMKVNTASSGSAPLEYLDPDQIERIEVVRGPRSTLYGADAVGGVINIITRKGSGDPALSVKVGGGSRGTGEYGLNFGGETSDSRFNLGARLFETQGYDRTVDSDKGLNWDDDAYRNKSVSGSFSRQFGKGIEVGANFAHSQGKSEYDNVYDKTALPVSVFKESAINTYVAIPVNNVWDTRVEAGFVRDWREDSGSGDTNYAENKRYSFSWLNDVAWADNQFLTTGVDYSNDRVDSNTVYIVDRRYNAGVFAQNLTSFDASTLQLGGRYDENEAYGGKFTGNASWGFDLPKQLRLVASYGTAFRAPTFADMYRQSSSAWSESIPNLDLKPEFSRNAELELRGVLGTNSHWSVNLYQNDMDDMLAAMEVKPHTWQTVNIDKARIRGLEFELSTSYEGLDINANLTFVDPENLSGENSGKKLHYRAEQMAALNLDKDFGGWTLGSTFRAQGKTWTDPANTKQIPGFGTVDLRASVKVTPELKAQFKAVNILDKNYQPVSGYRGEPRGIFATLIWTPEI